MTFHHASELVVGRESTPLELVDPVVEEPSCAGLRLVGPQVVEGLFEHVRFEELAAGAEKLVEGFPGLAPDVSPAREKDELLASQEPLEASGGLAQLGLADLVEGFQQMADDVELVVDDLNAGTVGL